MMRELPTRDSRLASALPLKKQDFGRSCWQLLQEAISLAPARERGSDGNSWPGKAVPSHANQYRLLGAERKSLLSLSFSASEPERTWHRCMNLRRTKNTIASPTRMTSDLQTRIRYRSMSCPGAPGTKVISPARKID